MNDTLEMPAPATKGIAAKHKILLVDDDPAIRQILVHLLADEGYAVWTAANGEEALDLVRAADDINLVLLDLNMPVKDGWHTFESLSLRNPLLPVILITARPNQFFSAVASGVGALLEKPLDFVKLFATIQTLLNEPKEVRLARWEGRTSNFCYIPSLA